MSVDVDIQKFLSQIHWQFNRKMYEHICTRFRMHIFTNAHHVNFNELLLMIFLYFPIQYMFERERPPTTRTHTPANSIGPYSLPKCCIQNDVHRNDDSFLRIPLNIEFNSFVATIQVWPTYQLTNQPLDQANSNWKKLLIKSLIFHAFW